MIFAHLGALRKGLGILLTKLLPGFSNWKFKTPPRNDALQLPTWVLGLG
jgi:hypothetical protein